MDLLQESIKNKKGKTPAQKLILVLLIISIILCIIVALIMFYVSMQDNQKEYSIAINGNVTNLGELKFMNSNNGKKYISLKALCNKLGYNYYNGEFRIPGEGENKGYIDNNKNIIQFFTDSKEIYKTTEKSKSDYEYYTLDSEILEYEGNLYISVEDVDVALNLILAYSENNNQTTIETPENWISKREEAFKEQNTVISNKPENLRALSYGYLIINRGDRYGVINLDNGTEVIGNKYASITFCEYNKNFIVSNTSNKFGVITKSGIAEIDLQYDSLEIINYNPLLYKVMRLEKFGVIRNDGSVINSIKYDSIGYPENKEAEINYTLIVPNLNENIPQSIVVCNEKKYGLIELDTGREIVPCVVDGIYTKADETNTYYAEIQKGKIYSLEIFVENLNRLATSVD